MKAICGLIIVGGFLEMLGIWLIVPFVGYFAGSEEVVVKVETILFYIGIKESDFAAFIILAFLTFFIAKTAFLTVALFLQKRFAFSARAVISSKLFASYLDRQYLFHTENHSGVLIRNVVGEVGVVISNALVPALALFGEIATVLLVVGLTFSIKPEFVVLAGILFGGVSVLFYSAFRSRITRWGKTRQDSDAGMLRQLQEAFGAIKEIKLYGAHDQFLTKYSLNADITAKMMSNEQTSQQLPRFVIELAIVIAVCLWILAYGSENSFSGQAVVDFALFVAVGFRLLPSITRIMSFVQSIRYAAPALETVMQEMSDATHEQAERIQEMLKRADSGSSLADNLAIRFRDVCFHFPGKAETKIVEHLNLSLKTGTCIGIVGPSGQGKTTIIDLVAGFYEPVSGEIMIADGNTAHKPQLGVGRIGYVSQSVRILDGTVAENVAFGELAKDMDVDRIRSSLEIAQLSSFVDASPEGLARRLTEDGRQMSGGQKQRIGIARALYRDCSLLLLDEVTSSLDTSSEEAVISALQALKGEVTIILVTHRKEPLTLCDEVYRLNGGRLQLEQIPGKRL
jgi:ABC-type multidrug transport system fused ATPase/permease subunit